MKAIFAIYFGLEAHSYLFFFQSCKNVRSSDREIESKVAQMMGRVHTKAPESSLIQSAESAEDEDKTYLLFTTGSLTYSPHQIGKISNTPE